MRPKPGSSAKLMAVQHREAHPTSIIRFYDPKINAKGPRGFTLDEILQWDDRLLECCHDYIQMLFPLPENSMYNLGSPIINREVMEAFRSRSELRDQLRRSLERMLSFYGFRIAVDSNQESQREHQGSNPEAESSAAAGARRKAKGEVKNGSTDNTARGVAPSAGASIAPAGANAPVFWSISRGDNWRKAAENWAIYMNHNHLRITRILRCLRVLGLEDECTAVFTALQAVYDDSSYHISERSMRYWGLAATGSLWISPDGSRCSWLERWWEGRAGEDMGEDLKKEVSTQRRK